MGVSLVQHAGSDDMIVAAARVSTVGVTDTRTAAGDDGLLRYLMKRRHGSPFEHGLFTWAVEAPILVFRELMRHRVASYNETSGRYRELEPVFYVPDRDRALVQVGKPGAYTFEAGTEYQHDHVAEATEYSCEVAWRAYQDMLAAGVAREVARIVLPVGLYSSAYVTMNPRALMNFLSLRTIRDGSTFPSFPMREIELVAEGMEADFAGLFPVTWQAFNAAGRVAP